MKNHLFSNPSSKKTNNLKEPENLLLRESSKESQNRLAAILGEAGIGLSEISLDGHFLNVNDELCRILGRSQDEVLQIRFPEITHPEDLSFSLAEFNRVVETGEPSSVNKRLLRPNGEFVWVNSYLTNLEANEERAHSVLVVTVDLTSSRESRERLRQSEKSLANAQRIAHLGSWDYDIPNGKVYYSDELYKIFDVPIGTFENNPGFIHEYIHPDDRAIVRVVVDLALAQGAFREFEYRVVRPGGEIRTVHAISEIAFDESGKPVRMNGTIQDITERKAEEEEKARLAAQVEYQSNRLNNIIASVPGVVWESSGVPGSDGQRINFVSDYVETLVGYTAEEWISTPNFWFKLVHPDDREKARQTAAEAFWSGRNYTQEYRWVAKDGRVVWIEANVVIVYDDEGKPVGLRGINLDITRRREIEAERARLTSELDTERTRLQHIFDHAPGFIFTLRGPQFVFEMVNPAFYQIVGRRELIGVSMRDSFPEVENQGFLDLLAQVYNTGEPFIGNEIPVEFVLPDSETTASRYINFTYAPMRESNGAISGILGYGVDVTEQVLARTKIEESEKRYRYLFSNNPLPMWIFEVGTLKFISVNQAAVEHYGYSQEEFLSMTLKDIRPAEDVPAFLEKSKKRFPGIDKAGIYRHRKKDGTIIFVEINSIQLNFDGRNAELVLANDITERRNAEEAMRQAETNYRNLVESSPGIVYRMNPSAPFATRYVSPNVEKYGYSVEEWYADAEMWSNIIYPEDFERVIGEFEAAIAQNLETNLEYRIVARDGSIHWWQDKGRFVTNEHGEKIGWQGIVLDITDTKELREQLRQSQKLESVGMLAGGIAHDFNNMLTAISGYSELTLMRLKPDDPLRQNIEEIKKAAARSADLTRQLLAFSRQQVLQPVVIDLNDAFADIVKMLHRVIGEDVQLTTVLTPNVGRVKVDPGQLSQILLNLAVNARDSMPQGGKLTIETANVYLDQSYTRQHLGVVPGEYVLLAVSDTGTGMSDEIKQRIFEPFFTTKEVGKGTGLGLATVYGIIKQSGGNIEVYSEEGIGTTFKIYLPRVAEQLGDMETRISLAEMPEGTETILLVEDEDQLRKLARQILEDCGYTVIEAANGAEALSLFEADHFHIDLLMTDVVMPQMGGSELARTLKTKLPKLSVLFTSGYTNDAVVRHGVMEAQVNFIQKPFAPADLANKVREILDNS